jgi:hypothetical protein
MVYAFVARAVQSRSRSVSDAAEGTSLTSLLGDDCEANRAPA